jgi:hypothetical protein
MPMTRIDDRINRRTALVHLTAATMLGASAAKAQRPDPSLAQIETTDLGHKTYMLEGQGGNILVVIGDDGIIMVDLVATPFGIEVSKWLGRQRLLLGHAIADHGRHAVAPGLGQLHTDGLQLVQAVVTTGLTKQPSSRTKRLHEDDDRVPTNPFSVKTLEPSEARPFF